MSELEGRFLALRALALYALSLGTAGSALLAWWPVARAAAWPLAALALGFAGALVLGEALAAGILTGRDPEARGGRIWLVALYVGVALLGLVGAVGWPRPPLLEREALLFSGLQAAFLLAPALARGHLVLLGNAWLLTVLAGLRGGPPAAVAALSLVLGLGFFLLFDHFASRLGPGRQADERLLRLAMREGLRLLAPVGLGLALFFAAVPPLPHAGLDAAELDSAASREELARAYAQLALAALSGASVVYYVSRLLRRRRSARAPIVQSVEPERGLPEPIVERPRRQGPRLEGTRGAVVRAYLRFLQAARQSGFQRKPEQTPREIATAVPAPAQPLGRLTALFMDARYGPAEPSLADVAAAEGASRAAIAGLPSPHAGTGAAGGDSARGDRPLG